jgi:hypothetical protein
MMEGLDMGLWGIGAGFAVGAAAGSTVVWLSRPRAQASAPAAAARVDEQVEIALAERDETVELCLELADRLRADDHPLWDWLNDKLASIDVEPVSAARGDAYDPAVHAAYDNVKTDDPALHRTIESLVFIGYRRGDEWIRKPKVVVYVADGLD